MIVLNKIHKIQQTKIAEIEETENMMYEKDRESQSLQEKFKAIKRKFDVISKDLLSKVTLCDSEYQGLLRTQSELTTSYDCLGE